MLSKCLLVITNRKSQWPTTSNIHFVVHIKWTSKAKSSYVPCCQDYSTSLFKLGVNAPNAWISGKNPSQITQTMFKASAQSWHTSCLHMSQGPQQALPQGEKVHSVYWRYLKSHGLECGCIIPVRFCNCLLGKESLVHGGRKVSE